MVRDTVHTEIHGVIHVGEEEIRPNSHTTKPSTALDGTRSVSQVASSFSTT